MKTAISVKLQIEGLHNWPEARAHFPEVGFLAEMHRHIFHIKAVKLVSHDDRDVEIILFKREIIDYIDRNCFSLKTNCIDFGPRSCEMIAKDLVEAFDLESCEVLEDNENGAIVWK
jgi:hypothetical protein